MSNEIMLKNNSAPAREISVVTAEIKELCRQASNIVLGYAIEIGRRLVEAKSVLPHGAWGDWLKNEVEFSQSTANNYMRLFEEYGSQQISLFGAVANSQTIANLPYSKALQLLLIPAEEREAFAEEVHADELSVKDLKTAIEDKLAAEKNANEEKKRADQLAEKVEAAEKARSEAEEKAAKADELQKTVAELEKKLKSSEKTIAEKEEALKKAENNPDIPPATLKKIKAEAKDAAEAEAKRDLQKQLDKALSDCDAAQKERKEAQKAADAARAELEQAQKLLKTASPEVAAFKSLFEEMQKMAITLKGKIEKIRPDDPETADKLAAALKAFGGTL